MCEKDEPFCIEVSITISRFSSSEIAKRFNGDEGKNQENCPAKAQVFL